MMIKHWKTYFLIMLGAITLFSCSDRKPARVYMPDMYYPVAYDPYQEAELAYGEYIGREGNDVPVFKNRSYETALQPVAGTVPMTGDSLLPYELKNDAQGYDESKTITTSPLKESRASVLERGKKLYGQNCAVCHGDAGDGKGSIVNTGAYSGVPNYKDREITVGSVYHVIMYGKNAMGSYASQLKEVDRWKVAEYVMQLKNAQ